jgi:UDP-N-acetylmuramate dehydrogenase
MTPAVRTELATRIGGDVRFGEPLARYTTYRIGGPAAAVVLPRHAQDVSAALRVAREEGIPWLVLGLGSNLLMADGGFDGVVIRMGKGMDRVERSGPEKTLWSVGAGLPTPLLSRQSAAAGHAGAHRLIGVPGTVGGGVFMNAGAHGQDFSLITHSVEVADATGDVLTLAGKNMKWRYRSSGLTDVVVLSAAIELTPADPQHTKDELALYLKKRREGTPFDEPCCGSVFRNPDGGRTAGQLIEACGLKGYRQGEAEVSPKHANYIVNLGAATASDVRRVIDVVRERVRAEFGITLELEVKLIGFGETEGP